MSDVPGLEFGLFHTNIDFESLNKDIIKSFNRPTTKDRKTHNARIFENYIASYNKMLEDSKKMDEILAIALFHERQLRDFEQFCLTYVRLDNNLPMFTSPWQSECARFADEYETISGLMSRKMGKSAFMTAYIMYRMINFPPEHAVLFAPTDDQLMVMSDIQRAITVSDFMKEEFVILNGPRDKKGKLGSEEILFARPGVYSDVLAFNLSLNTIGDTKRGQKGTIFFVDEQQLVPVEIQQTVIDPMMADAYSEKKKIKFGTPSRRTNPNADLMWENEVRDPEIYTVSYDWVEGIRTGCIRPSYMKRVFKNMGIPCPFGTFHGLCGIRSGINDQEPRQDLHIDQKTGEILTPECPGYDKAWKCDKCCELHASFMEEYGAKFSTFTNTAFPDPIMEDSGDSSLMWQTKGKAGEKYVIAVDPGVVMFPTQLGVFKVMDDKMEMVFHRELPPLNQRMMQEYDEEGNRVEYNVEEKPANYDEILQMIWETSNVFSDEGEVLWYFIDITNNIHFATSLVNGPKALPKSKIYRNETAANKGLYGIWNTLQFNNEMKSFYQRMLFGRRIKVPRMDPFWTKYRKEHKEVIVKKAETAGAFYRFLPPRGKHVLGTVDIIDMMSMASLALRKNLQYIPAKTIYYTHKPDKAKRGGKHYVIL